MWILGSYWRNRLIDEVFEAGYGSRDNELHLQRWTKDEMHQLCEDKDLLSLWLRYVTYWPKGPNGETKEDVEKEVLAEIAILEMLV